MENKTDPTMEQIEQKLLGWEKWLYACFGAAMILFAHALIKANENAMLTDLFFLQEKAIPTDLSQNYIYVNHMNSVMLSPERIWLWGIVELAALVPAAILAFHSSWRKIILAKRLDLIFGYLLAAWVALLSLGAQDPLNVGNGYNVFVIVYLLALALGYRQLRRKKDKAEEVFP